MLLRSRRGSAGTHQHKLLTWQLSPSCPPLSIFSFLTDAISLWLHSRCQRHTQMIAPTNRPSSNPVYFGALVWVDSVVQHHTWSTAVQAAAAEVEWGECTMIISLLQHKMVIKVFRWVIANYKCGCPAAQLSWGSSNRLLIEVGRWRLSLGSGLCVAARLRRGWCNVFLKHHCWGTPRSSAPYVMDRLWPSNITVAGSKKCEKDLENPESWCQKSEYYIASK